MTIGKRQREDRSYGKVALTLTDQLLKVRVRRTLPRYPGRHGGDS